LLTNSDDFAASDDSASTFPTGFDTKSSKTCETDDRRLFAADKHCSIATLFSAILFPSGAQALSHLAECFGMSSVAFAFSRRGIEDERKMNDGVREIS
jgi:hypothetical protein